LAKRFARSPRDHARRRQALALPLNSTHAPSKHRAAGDGRQRNRPPTLARRVGSRLRRPNRSFALQKPDFANSTDPSAHDFARAFDGLGGQRAAANRADIVVWNIRLNFEAN